MPHVHNALHRFTEQQAGYRAAVGEQDPLFAGIERAGETLTPILNLWERPEWALRRGERLWAVSPSVAATAAEFGQVGIRNPAGSGVLCVVTHMFCMSTAFGAQHIQEARLAVTTATDASASPLSRDTRELNLTGGTGPLVSLAHSDAVRIGALLMAWSSHTSGSGQWNTVPVVLSPGFQLMLGVATVNIAIQATLAGYWRRALPGEL